MDDVATVADVLTVVDVAVDVATVVEGREKGGFIVGVGGAPRCGVAGRHGAGEGVVVGGAARGEGRGMGKFWEGRGGDPVC